MRKERENETKHRDSSRNKGYKQETTIKEKNYQQIESFLYICEIFLDLDLRYQYKELDSHMIYFLQFI